MEVLIMKRNLTDARIFIAALDLSDYIEKAKKLYPDINLEVAEAEYRHHLLLCSINKIILGDDFIVPTKNADPIWHQHILDTHNYTNFCRELLGRYLHHDPNLIEGSDAFNRAVEHTRTIHQSSTVTDSFVLTMYSTIIADADVDSSQTDVTAGEASVSSIASDAVSCGAGCGGAGCGGG
ncbi:hypothetical protein HOB94_07680 [bacterium]|nr:hypothetical protein [bacterium]MBT4633757.1 hypothetical protein [bacterium]